jgi:lipopolysaccharide biosynthesis glycosyltransferase
MTINVAYSCNENYIHHTGISILSLLENNQDIENISVYFIPKDVSNISIASLKTLVERYKRNFVVIPFNDLCHDLKISSIGRHISTIYAKLFFERIKSVDKILYIDSDTIVADSLRELWNIELGSNLIAGVETYTVSSKRYLGLNKHDNFINDGVVLLNLKEFRRHNLAEKFIKCIAEYGGNPPLYSEGVINKVCKEDILSLHPKYNFMSGLIDYRPNRFAFMDEYYDKKTIDEAFISPVIVHYLSAFFNRPWDVNCTHPLKHYYLHYKALSEWKDFPMEDKKLSTKLQTIKIAYKFVPHIIFDFLQYLKESGNRMINSSN